MTPDADAPASEPIIVGRYVLYGTIATGGMASVHLGSLLGAAGFSRTVAIKRLHPHLARDPDFPAMLLDEARLATRIRHPNVVPTFDVVAMDGELLVVMEYVEGESLAQLSRIVRERGGKVPASIGASIIVGMLEGLHAAHEAHEDDGSLLSIVHRDVSPQNVLVGVDGVARLIDFGVAKALGRVTSTEQGQIKGKAGYMAPEQIRGDDVTPRTDVFAAAVVLWEVLTGERLFFGKNTAATLFRVLEGKISPPSSVNPALDPGVDQVVLRGLERDPTRRFGSAREMVIAIEASMNVARARDVAEWLREHARESLAEKSRHAALVLSSGERSMQRRVTDVTLPTLKADSLSQASSISVTRPIARSAPRHAAIALVVLLAVVAVVVVLTSRRRVTSDQAVAPSFPTTTSVASLAAVSGSVAPDTSRSVSLASGSASVPKPMPLPTRRPSVQRALPVTSAKPEAKPAATPGSIYGRH